MISLFLKKGVRFMDGAKQGYSEQQTEHWRNTSCEWNAFVTCLQHHIPRIQ